MNARILPVRELGSEDEAAWRTLAERAVEPNPLYEPDCLVPAAEHQQFGDEIDIVFAEEGGRVFACIPVRQVRKWRGFPYPFVTTVVRRMLYCGTPLVDPERSEEALGAILAALAERRGFANGRVLVLQEVAEGGAVDHAVQMAARHAGFPLFRYESWERPIAYRREEANYRSIHSSKFRGEVRRRHKRLGECLGAEPEVVDRSNDPAAIDEYIEMEAAGYKGETGIAMATVPGEPEYFRGMCQRFAQRGRLRILALEGGGKTVAMVVSIRGGEGLFGIKTSYDEQFSRFAPGVQLQLSAIEDFHHRSDARWLDPCTYEGNEVMLGLYPDRTRFSSFFVPLSRNPVDRLAVHAFVGMRTVHKRAYDTVASRRVARGSDKAKRDPGAPPKRERGQQSPVGV